MKTKPEDNDFECPLKIYYNQHVVQSQTLPVLLLPLGLPPPPSRALNEEGIDKANKVVAHATLVGRNGLTAAAAAIPAVCAEISPVAAVVAEISPPPAAVVVVVGARAACKARKAAAKSGVTATGPPPPPPSDDVGAIVVVVEVGASGWSSSEPSAPSPMETREGGRTVLF